MSQLRTHWLVRTVVTLLAVFCLTQAVWPNSLAAVRRTVTGWFEPRSKRQAVSASLSSGGRRTSTASAQASAVASRGFARTDTVLANYPIASPSAGTGARHRRLITRPIETLRPGMRVLASNPQLIGPPLPDTVIVPEVWRLLRLRMIKPDGSSLDIELHSAARLDCRAGAGDLGRVGRDA